MNAEKLTRKRAQIVKGFGIGTLVASAVLLAPIIFGLSRAWGPQCTTMYLHYNLQYRAGNIQVENTILNESLRAMVTMMDRHPSWHYTIECQAYAIERLLREPESFPGILEIMQKQNNHGQLEILCGVYSSQILAAFPAYALDLSYTLTADILAEAGLNQSRALVHQEGQVTAGLAVALNNNSKTRIDTIIVSRQQIEDFWPGQKADWTHPIQRITVGGKTINLLVYDYLPRYEAGYWHGWTWTLDAELALEVTDDADYEFQVDPNRVADWERHYANLERHGNKFFTVEEWVNHCEKNNYVEDLPHYQPTTHWGPTKYDTCFVWYGNGQGNVDDGAMHAMNYRTQAIYRATRWLYDEYGAQYANATAKAEIGWCFANASRTMVLAMVTDTTGISPNPVERQYGYDNAGYAIANCSRVIEILQWAWTNAGVHPDLAGANQIQVNLEALTNITNPSAFTEYAASQTLSGPVLNETFPLLVETELRGTINQTKVAISQGTYTGIPVTRLTVTFPGTNVWAEDFVNCALHFKGKNARGTNEIMYPIALAEDLPMVRITRTDYTPDDILQFHLPLSSGLIFIPETPGATKGAAIIWNCSSYQIAPRWVPEEIVFQVTELHLDATFEFFLLNDTTAEDAQDLANQLNTYQNVIVAPTFSGMEGYEYFQAYSNSVKGEDWSAVEWW